MQRIALGLLGLAVVLLAVGQLAIPPLAERRVADRLERDGGQADVSLTAFPALRLLFDDGDSLEVEGSGLRLDLTRERGALGRVDGFDEVSLQLDEISAEPLDISSFELEREDGQRAYSLDLAATTSPREVARFLGSRAGGSLGGLLGDLSAGALPGGGATRVPLDLHATVESRDGRARVGAVEASVAGIPAGPLAEVVMEAVLARL